MASCHDTHAVMIRTHLTHHYHYTYSSCHDALDVWLMIYYVHDKNRLESIYEKKMLSI